MTENRINVNTLSLANGLQITAASQVQAISATNNKAQYYADLAKKYCEDSKTYRDNAKYYAEQNSDVTVEYVNNIKSGLEQKINLKQAALTAGNNISISGQTISAIVPAEISDLTDDTATNPVDQSDGVKDIKTSNADKFWTGTKAEYDAITTKDSNTFYNITDDSDITLSLLQTIYPVGSIYITTNSTCPLSALFGTWTLVGADRVLQGAGTRGAVGTTVDESLPNITGRTNSWEFQGVTSTGGASVGASGVFSSMRSISTGGSGIGLTGATNGAVETVFNASNSSSTYQDNAPVQQDAYLVNIYRRTA